MKLKILMVEKKTLVGFLGNIYNNKQNYGG